MLAVVEILVCVALIAWWVRFTGGDFDDSVRPSTSELAYLRGGPVLAMLASLFWLRAHDVVTANARHEIVQSGRLPPGTNALTAAVFLATDPVGTWPSIVQDARVGVELVRIRRRLIFRGLLMREQRLRRLRRVALIPAAFAVIIELTWSDQTMLSWPQGVAYALGLVVFGVFVASPEKTRAGRHALRRYRPAPQHVAGVARGQSEVSDRIDVQTLELALTGIDVLWRQMSSFAIAAGLPGTLELPDMWMPHGPPSDR